MPTRRILTVAAAGVVAAVASAVFVADRGAADVPGCPPPVADGVLTNLVVVDGCPPTPVGTMALDELRFGDHDGNLSTADVFGLRWSFRVPPAVDGLGAARADVKELTVAKRVDKASPILLRRCAAGSQLRTAEIKLFRVPGDARPYLTVRLSDVVCTGYALVATGGPPLETISLTFARIEFIHTTQEGTTSRGGYDFRTNRAT